MKAETQSLQTSFQSTVRYAVPLYQRPYVWRSSPDDPESDRLGPFWDDVNQTIDRYIEHRRLVAQAGGDAEKVAPMTPHFFGAVVIGGPVKEHGGVTSHEVIDGQQRLTTTQLLIAAASRLCDAHQRPKHASRLQRLWTQDSDLDVSDLEQFKLSPTRFDRSSFLDVMTAEPTTKSGTLDRIPAAYRFFRERLEEWVSSIPVGEDDAYFDALRDTIYDHLLLVVIELQAGDNPQGIFESLNAQGEPLLAIDLVKNQVFRAAKRAGMDLDHLDTDVWSARFGDEWWRTEVKQGRYKRPRAELFLMHWLTEQTDADISATGLYVEFVRLAEKAITHPEDTKKFIDRFVNDAGTYRRFDQLDSASRERLFFERREALDIGVVFPVALRLWHALSDGTIDQPRLVTGLRALESWMVRRMVLRATTQGYNRVLVETLGKMSAAVDPVGALVQHLQSFTSDSVTAWWPDDIAFTTQLTERPLYGAQTQQRVRLLLQAAELRLHTPKTETIPLPSKLTIEHIIPQTWDTTWPLPEDASDEVVVSRKDHVHRLGNLTLVTSSLNPSLSNDPWADKRAALAKHSALRLNAVLVHDHPETFDESAIDARGQSLVELLIAEWPGPDADWS